MRTDDRPTDSTAARSGPTPPPAAGSEASSIAVVGGGICGLTTALALDQRGFAPTVYEAADGYGPVGAGILLQTNAMLVLDRLDVADRIRDAGVPLDGGGLRAPGGEFMTRFDLNDLERDEFGYGFVAVHRADLLDVLRGELDTEVRTGMDCVDVVGTDPPTVHFDDGTTATPDLLVGADGIDSAVRDAVAPAVAPARSMPSPTGRWSTSRSPSRTGPVASRSGTTAPTRGGPPWPRTGSTGSRRPRSRSQARAHRPRRPRQPSVTTSVTRPSRSPRSSMDWTRTTSS